MCCIMIDNLSTVILVCMLSMRRAMDLWYSRWISMELGLSPWLVYIYIFFSFCAFTASTLQFLYVLILSLFASVHLSISLYAPDLLFIVLTILNSQALNLILLTSLELSELRDLLKQSLVNPAGKDLFVSLYASWCHSPMAIISLCLLAQVGIQNLVMVFYFHWSCFFLLLNQTYLIDKVYLWLFAWTYLGYVPL